MDTHTQRRITLLSLMAVAGGESLESKYEEAAPMVLQLEQDGWFGPVGKSSGQNRTSTTEESSSASSDDRPASRRLVQKVLDLDDTQDVAALEAMTMAEIKALLATLS